MLELASELDDTQLKRYEKSPIYRDARFYMRNAVVIRARMPKGNKYSEGEALVSSCVKIACMVAWAYLTRDLKRKMAYIEAARRGAVRSSVLHRVLFDCSLMSRELFVIQGELADAIMRQANGWLEDTRIKFQAAQVAQAGVDNGFTLSSVLQARTASPVGLRA